MVTLLSVNTLTYSIGVLQDVVRPMGVCIVSVEFWPVFVM